MLKLYVLLFLLLRQFLMILADGKNTNSTLTLSSKVSSILSKFHQNDYKFTLEWAELVRIDNRYADYKLYVFKYNRSTTAEDMTFNPKVEMGYNIEAIAQMYKFASNEYRLFPMRFQFNICEAISTQAMGYDKLAKLGNFSCPFRKGATYYVHNWTPEESRLPPLIPSGKFMMELQLLLHDNEILLTRTYVTISRPILPS